jgi:hypothetical protein
MNCPKCNQLVEAGAAFCGNCGQALLVAAAPAPNPLPLYAVAQPGRHVDENKAWLSLLFGLVGIVGALFLALAGLALGIVGLVFGTMSRSGTKRGLSTAGLAVSSLAVLAGLGVWVYAINHNPRFHNETASSAAPGITAPTVSASSLTTPCYSAGFVDKLNVSNSNSSCDMSAFNGPTLSSSSNAYKVYASQSTTATADNFTSLAKPAIEKEQASQFAGSPAYVVNTSDKISGVAVIEAAVLHKVGNGDNVFILVHAVNGKTADLNVIEAEWQWQ